MPSANVLSDTQWANDVLLPHHPYATNRLERGQYRMSREDVLAMRYVEHSPHALLGSIVIDCDHTDAALRAFEQPSDHPAPNWVALSPSGRNHIGWWLAAPFCRTDSARLQPLRFAQRIEASLRTSAEMYSVHLQKQLRIVELKAIELKGPAAWDMSSLQVSEVLHGS